MPWHGHCPALLKVTPAETISNAGTTQSTPSKCGERLSFRTKATANFCSNLSPSIYFIHFKTFYQTPFPVKLKPIIFQIIRRITSVMLFKRGLANNSGDGEYPGTVANPKPSEKPLVCVIYFFASQMSRNIQAAIPPPGVNSTSSTQTEPRKVHQLDNLLSKVQHHAHLSPLITKFETIPVEMAPPGRPRGTSREAMHDTLLLVNFKSKQAWREWVQTKEWQEFMQRTEKEAVFRRLPHVTCANSLKGLRNPIEVLMA
ncbi:hypothetical protein PAAG_04034 [Paracoccidioides lutzii Pb01]|uniref:Uncharacterized protein n=1 Tax=Paracoccidioides lutzii (strain ATCC MYA-826 / Pb01) TaxID=502779 RepID=C1GZU0_PARBA|nr:hypothetical protein PAAG_04034 [Paracoccidioides lutzii Pb01]EEH32981.2 hypothetical protein PAAG_04034 [Paracoccidioides lutzii Pb01]